MASSQSPGQGGHKYPAELLDHYVIKDTVGTGGFAKVKLARHRMTGEKVAVKIMDKEQLKKTDDLKRVALEIQALKDLRHQNISQLYHVIETDEKYFLVLEYAPGGEMFDYIINRDRCKEEEARVFFRQICAAVKFCHSKGYVHRDLKPENLLLDNNHNIKLIDFGLISHPKDMKTDKLKTCCGSAAYAAPELIRGERYLGEPADVWSLGILLYALLCGFLPFDDENTQKLYRLIQRGVYEIPPWLSKDSQKFIGQMLQHKADHRLTMDQILSHPWLLKGLNIDAIDPNPSARFDGHLEQAIISELAKYYNADHSVMEAIILGRDFDNFTAEYELLVQRFNNGHSIKLPSKGGKIPARTAMKYGSRPSNTSLRVESPMSLLSSATFGSSLALGQDGEVAMSSGPYLHPPGSVESLARSALDDHAAIGSSNPASHRRVQSNVDGMGTSNLVDMSRFSGSMHTLNAGSEGTAADLKRHSSNPTLSPMKPAKASVRAPEPRPLQAQDRSSSFKGSFGGLVRSFTNLFGSSHRLVEPKVVKGIFNVNTTSTKDASAVADEIVRVCKRNGFDVRAKNFTIKAKQTTESNPVTISFEVCRLAAMDLRGIRLKRVKGDTWAYKTACQNLLAQFQL